MYKGAIFSSCKKHRLQLWREWDSNLPKVLFIMLNPSTADDQQDDPTLRRCKDFAKQWGYGGLYVGNLYSLRAVDPKTLLKVSKFNHRDNYKHLVSMVQQCQLVVCAWGNYPIIKKLGITLNVFNHLEQKLYCIALSKTGTPKHPLYLKNSLTPIPFALENQ
jgi:hypothetical protein